MIFFDAIIRALGPDTPEERNHDVLLSAPIKLKPLVGELQRAFQKQPEGLLHLYLFQMHMGGEEEEEVDHAVMLGVEPTETPSKNANLLEEIDHIAAPILNQTFSMIVLSGEWLHDAPKYGYMIK